MWIWEQVGDIVKRLNLKDKTEYDLLAEAFSKGCYHLITKWLKEDIQKTPSEIANVFMTVTTGIFGPF